MNYYIGIDLGTSALKLLLVDGNGVVIRSVTKEYPISYPCSGWSEQHPENWWKALEKGIPELTKHIDRSQISAISTAGQMHGLVILDQQDKVIRPAILWNDGRTGKETDFLNNTVGKELLSEETANIAFAGFTLPKLLWLKENEPENFKNIHKIMLPKDYINYRLTGVHCTDYSDASGTLMLDVKNKKWSKKMLDLCGIDIGMMPKLFESFDQVGTVTEENAQAFGFDKNVIVTAGAGDNAAAAIGTGSVGQGKCNISLGTSGTIFISFDHFGVDENNALHSFCHADGGYHLMGCILSAAACSKWFCEEILKTKDYQSEETAIQTDRLGKNEVFFLPYLMGERSPINDACATGVFIGLRPNTSRADLVQAVLEGVAFAIKENVEVGKKLGIRLKSSCLCGGGAKSELWRTILSNVLNIELHLPACEEGPGYGAAILAMVGNGEYKTVSECCQKLVAIRKKTVPQEKLVKLYEDRYLKFKKIYPRIKELYQELREGE